MTNMPQVELFDGGTRHVPGFYLPEFAWVFINKRLTPELPIRTEVAT